MAYQNRFIATDNLIIHLNPLISGITDSALKSNYAGFLSVSAVTVFELAIKDIFIEFAQKKNPVFGGFIEKHFANINGRIRIDELKSQHIKPFGAKYLEKFEKKLRKREKIVFTASRKNVRSDYSNLIICRHKYVHVGSPSLTFEEVLDNYQVGKEVIHSLYEAMQR
ncbi:HEPN domain-containing protein [Gaoshiqia sediminis]|uniref:HEPN domain-containing protein n=1 Tax=Gaoshiqia sediminis TaxID=2986998 RepID=A0AA41Y7W9_9BACT|nr:HEPN domain-containing protein [Gaoshiqia sediminis]MCW0482767.1 HEPN domain-containing protein [Gaoshiqia sediminis]